MDAGEINELLIGAEEQCKQANGLGCFLTQIDVQNLALGYAYAEILSTQVL